MKAKFECGDKIVYIDCPEIDSVFEVEAVLPKKDYCVIFFEGDLTICDDIDSEFRHATNAEIKAGKRLEGV
mgnify:CR=1 FL=1